MSFCQPFSSYQALPRPDNTRRLECILLLADSLFDPLSQTMQKMILRSTMKLVKMRLPSLKSVYSVSDLEFKDRIFHAPAIANTYFL